MTKLSANDENSLHIKKVFSSVSSDKTNSIDSIELPLISRSWKRCLNQHNISPEERFSPLILEERRLREHQDAFSDIHSLAKNSVNKLYSLIADIGYTVLLTDNNGVTLDCRYDPECEHLLKTQGLHTGTDWSEKSAGTNGIGTCIVEEASVIIRNEEHFFPIMLGMTCIVSPIFDNKGKLIASLDATTLRPETIGQNKLVSRLVEQYAILIESLYFINNYSDHWLLRFSISNDMSDNMTTGILAINEDGIITAGNRIAYNTLCKKIGYKIHNRAFHEVFDMTFKNLLDEFSKRLSTCNTLRATDSGLIYFFSLNPPAIKTSSSNQKTFLKKTKNKFKKHPDLSNLTGNDVHMQIITKKIRQTINLDLHYLIYGETGTGKEALARAIHDESLRKDKPFIAINCASIPDSLIESELFGYSNGAFTGALKKGVKGKILQANEGTLFLDEIGDMPIHLQTRLLRVLSEMEVVPLGESSAIPLNIQLISATNKLIPKMIEEKIFRSDLYFRLHGISIDLPSLRNRTDKDDLINNIFNTHSSSKAHNISESSMNILMNYSWPGNIRQLINVAKYSNAMCLEETITDEHLPDEIKTNNSKNIKYNIHYSEYDLLISSLKNNKWNITKVSNQLNICRATVYRKMKKYNIISPNDT